jgi:hypothetical protein
MMRNLMIEEMRFEIPAGQNVNTSSRYRHWFYRDLEFPEGTIIGKGMRRRIAKFNAGCENKYNVDTLEELTDEELFKAFRSFMKAYCRWM